MLESMPEVFGSGKDCEAEQMEQERDRLYKKVGQLQVQVDFLKKTPDFWTDGGRQTRHGGAGPS